MYLVSRHLGGRDHHRQPKTRWTTNCTSGKCVAKMAATDSFHKLVHDELSCPICFEEFEEPKSLPKCAHNVCKACLEQMMSRNPFESVECPMCRVNSPVPAGGIDEFPTNSLLVRLLDSSPGRKEKKAIQEALKECKEKLQAAGDRLEVIQSHRSSIKGKIQRAQELKREISKNADEIVKKVRSHEIELCSGVDRYLNDNCGVCYEGLLEDSEAKLENLLEQTSMCLPNVEETLRQGDVDEIVNMHEFIIEQLREFTEAMDFSVLDDIDINPSFDLSFENGNRKTGEELLGRVSRPREDRVHAGPSLRVFSCRNNSSLSWDENDDLDTEELHVPSLDAAQADAGINQVRKHVNLQFVPTSFSVSPKTGELVILWAERRQVWLYSTTGKHLHTIYVKYGDLQDVTFSADDFIIVVNRANQRLLYFNKEGIFQQRFMKISVSDVRLTCVSVDYNGRLILTSTCSVDGESTSEEEGRPCVLVFTEDRDFSFMFGEENLVNPYGKAIYHNEIFFVPDSNGQFIKLFNEAGQYLHNLDTSQCISSDFNMHLTVDTHNNNLIVVDRSYKKLMVLTVDGETTDDSLSMLRYEPRYIEMFREDDFFSQSSVFVIYFGCKFFEILSF